MKTERIAWKKPAIGLLIAAMGFVLLIVIPLAAQAQTPDGETPAEEEACDKYVGEGARHGLCIAYCEAQDCELFKDDESCRRIQRNFINYSVKKGYSKGMPKPGKATIDCSVTGCTPEDIKLCRGKERDCWVDGECTAICTRTFEGFSSEGKPLCSLGKICKKCVPDDECEFKVCEEPMEELP